MRDDFDTTMVAGIEVILAVLGAIAAIVTMPVWGSVFLLGLGLRWWRGELR